MNTGKYVFAQVLSLVNRYEFQKCVNRYNGDYRTRELNCWNQFAQLFFGQLTARNGLRDICLCLNAHKNNLYHLGIKQRVNQSTLSRANESRDWRIFADFGTYLINLVQPLYAETSVSDLEIDKDVFVLDSTNMDVLGGFLAVGGGIGTIFSSIVTIGIAKSGWLELELIPICILANFVAISTTTIGILMFANEPCYKKTKWKYSTRSYLATT